MNRMLDAKRANLDMWARRASVLLLLATTALLTNAVFAKEPDKRRGTVTFEPAANEAALPERFRLERHTFDFVQTPETTSSKAFTLSTVTFPSPVTTPEPNNNTVHCEYFQPVGAGRHPGVIVLHILGGDFPLSRLFARTLASNGTAALFVKMPYYGPRRQPNSPARMVSLDPHETVRGMTQAVLDVRQAAAWLAAQPEIDADQLGIMGISLGGITAALSSTAEPRFHKVCLILAGGGVGEVMWEAKELAKVREAWTAKGGTKESLFEVLKAVDPVTYAVPIEGRKILMLNARQDEVIPPRCTEALWIALGKPEIVWWEAGHYSAMRYMFEGLSRTAVFFRAPAVSPTLSEER